MISSRRTLLAEASAFTINRPELVRGAGKERLKAGLVGCGSRGTQALTNLLGTNRNGHRVAMGDMFEDRVENAVKPSRPRSLRHCNLKSRWVPSIDSLSSTPARNLWLAISTSSSCVRRRSTAPSILKRRRSSQAHLRGETVRLQPLKTAAAKSFAGAYDLLLRGAL